MQEKNNTNLERMRELIEQLTEADIAYYKNDAPIMTDLEYDRLTEDLASLEHDTGLVLSGSPTQKVSGEILESLAEVRHTKPMLSAGKTKSIEDLIRFAAGRAVLLSWKMDGLTLVLRYEYGKLKQAITRGREGIIGEDVTHTVRTFRNVPLTIPTKESFEVRGEGVISWESFHRINASLEESYTLEAVGEVFPEAKYQRCTVHLYRNVFSVTPRSKVKLVAKMLKAIHAQESKKAAREKAKAVVEELRSMKLKEAAKKVEDGIEETLTYCDFPSEHWTRIRTNNVIERLNREIRRRTRVVGSFPDGNSALMLVCARLRHVAGTQWGNKKYMNMKHLEAAMEDASLAGYPDSNCLQKNGTRSRKYSRQPLRVNLISCWYSCLTGLADVTMRRPL